MALRHVSLKIVLDLSTFKFGKMSKIHKLAYLGKVTRYEDVVNTFSDSF